MLELLRQRRWLGFTVFALAVLVLCAILARWQWSRYQERLAENDRLDAAISAPAVPVDELLDARPADTTSTPVPDLAPELEWRTASATGTFDADGQRAVRRRPLDGRNGFWIVTPLVTDSGVLLVNRGWAPAGSDATTAPEVPAPPTGQVTVTGRLRSAEPTETQDAPPDGQAWATDPSVLVTPDEVLRYDAYLEMRSSTVPADEGLTALSDPGHRGLNNLVYSVQWLIFGLVAAIGWWRLMKVESTRPEGTESPQGSQRPDEPESPNGSDAPGGTGALAAGEPSS